MGFLSGITDTIFGSDPTFEQKQLELLTPAERKLQEEVLFPQLREGRGSAGLSGLEQTSLAGLEELAMQAAAGTSATARLSKTGATQLQDIFTRGPQDTEEFFRTTVQEPALRDFEENILPRIARRFSGGNFFGSERFEADTRAREDLLQSLTQARSSISFQSRQQDVENVLKSAGLIGAVTSGPMAELIALLSSGKVPRQVELDRLASQDIRIGQILAALGMQTVENVNLTTPGSEGLLSSIAGGLGQGAGAAAGAAFFASSRELKDIGEPLDEQDILDAFLKLPIEKWNYKGDNKKYIGTYAEDFKDAFGVGDGKTINFIDAIGVTMASVQALAKRVGGN